MVPLHRLGFAWGEVSTGDILSALFGVSGWAVFALEHLRHRRDSTHDILSEVLDPFVHALQKLNNAKDARKANDRLRRAYPEKQPEVVITFNRNVETYGKLLGEAKELFQQFERAIVSNRFRFPDKVYERLNAAKTELAKTGEYLNDGSVDQVDIGIAAASSVLKELNKYARGFRLQAPFAFLRHRAEKRYEQEAEKNRGEHSISESEMEQVIRLINKRIMSQAHNPFVIHPPKKLLDDLSIMTRDDCIEQRTGGRWNPVGLTVVYASLSPATAMAETLAHFRYYGLPVQDAIRGRSWRFPLDCRRFSICVTDIFASG